MNHKVIFVKLQKLLYDNYWIILITTIGILLRLYKIDSKPLWLDEAQLYIISLGEYSQIITKNALSNSTPVLFPFITNTALHFGSSEFVLRFPSFIFGALCIPLLYILCREFLSKVYSLITILFFSISAKQIYYSQQVREYSLAMLLSLILNYYYIKIIKKQSRKNLFILLIVITISVWTQYGLILLISSLQLILALLLIYKKIFTKSTITRTQIIYWLTISLILLINCIFVYITSFRFQYIKNGFGANYLSEGYWSGTLSSLIKLGIINLFGILNFSFPLNLIWLIIIPSSLILMLQTKKNILAIIFTFIPLLTVFICALFKLYPFIAGRQLMPFISFIYIIIAYGIKYIHKNVKPDIFVYFILIILIQGLIDVKQLYAQKGPENIRPIINTLITKTHYNDLIYVYYGAKPAFTYYFPTQKNNKKIYGIKSRDNEKKYLSEIDTILKDKKNSIWFVFSHNYEDEIELISNYLIQNYGAILVSSDSETSLLLIE